MNSEFMKAALAEARSAARGGEVPVGAVIVKNGEIIARGRNRREEKQNALSHAETEAINAACKYLGSWRLDGCEMYSHLRALPYVCGRYYKRANFHSCFRGV